MKTLLKILFTMLLVVGTTCSLYAQIGIGTNNFPDANFRNYVSTELDEDGDGILSAAEIAAITHIDVNSKKISDLKGIEHFTALTWLSCYENQLTSLDVSNNTALTLLSCHSNQLTSLNVSSNTALTELYCSANQITSLDVSSNTALTNLDCSVNQLTSLDISNNTALIELDCSRNQFTDFNVSNTALTKLNCSENQLTALNVSNTTLTHLNCSENQLTALDLSNNTALTHLNCTDNQFTTLDLSNNTALTKLDCSGNQLTALNLSNNTALEYLICSNNPISTLDITANPSLNYFRALGVAPCFSLTATPEQLQSGKMNSLYFVSPCITPVTGINLDNPSLSLGVGEIKRIYATVLPENATNKMLTWSSSDTAVATVNYFGLVTAISEGSTTITIKTDDGNFTATCEVTVHEPAIPVISVSIDCNTKEIELGNNFQLHETINPDNATDKTVTWSSSDTAVATVNNSGTVTAIGEGSAIIIVKTNDGGATDACRITVYKPILVTGVSIDYNTKIIELGNNFQLHETVTPYNAMDKTVTWSSSDTTVATVNSSGIVTATGVGSATITVTTNNGGFTSVCNVTVPAPIIPIDNISINPREVNISKGSSVQLTTIILPENNNDTYYWISSDKNIAVVDSTGMVTGISAGTDTILVISVINNLSDMCIVTVTEPIIDSNATISDDINIYIGNNRLHISDNTAKEIIYVYTLEGTLIDIIEKTELSMVRDASSYPRGVLIVSSNNWSTKVFKN